MAIIDATPFEQLTDAELQAERTEWDRLIKNAVGWGSAYQAAIDCRTACDAMLARRAHEARPEAMAS